MRSDARLAFSISTTTRPPRGAEKDGCEYYFRSREQFMEMVEKGEFLEWAEVHGNCYGSTKKEVDRIAAAGRIPIFDIDVQGAAQLKKTLPGAVFIFIFPPSREILRQRLENRNTDSPGQVQLRLKNALEEMRQWTMFDYAVINDELTAALDDVRSVIRAELLRTQRMYHVIDPIQEEGE
jgi:guanylate kinase